MPDSALLTFEALPSLGAAYRRAIFCRKPGLKDGELIPPIEARVEGVRLEADRLRDYRRLCGFAESTQVPITYPQMLANSLHAELILSPSFPLRPIAVVHRSVMIEERRALHIDEPLDFSCRLEGQRETDVGIEVDVETKVESSGTLVWSSVATILFRHGGGGGKRRRSKVDVGDEKDRVRSTIWKLPSDLGRAYASVAKDYNPIHLSVLSAKLFGFRRAIIHGLWSVARCVGELDADMPLHPIRLEAQFKRPIFLPGTVLFTAGRTGDGVAFGLRSRDGAKPHLVGTASALGPAG